MIISAAIVSQDGQLICAKFLPEPLKNSMKRHSLDFIFALKIEDDDVELPYIETSSLRYIYKQTDDLYWLMVTKTDSDMFKDIELLGKFVCTIMEYGSSDTNSRTLTDEQINLFYQHLCRPWDGTECPTCDCSCLLNVDSSWQKELDNRLQFLISIRDGNVDDSAAQYYSALIKEAWSISQLSPRLSVSQESGLHVSESSSQCSHISDEISEDILIDGCRLKCRLEDIRVELKRMQDPYLRLFARRDLLLPNDMNKSMTIGTAPSYSDMDSESNSGSGHNETELL